MEIRDVLLKRQAIDRKEFSPNIKYVKGVTIGVDNASSPLVSGRPGFFWVREIGVEGGSIVQAFNTAVATAVNLRVVMAYTDVNPYRKLIIGIDWASLPDSSGFVGQPYGIQNHSPFHEWMDRNPGLDALTIFTRAVAPLRTYPSVNGGLAVDTYQCLTYSGVYSGQIGLDLTSSVPVTGYTRFTLVYLDMDTMTIDSVDGSVVAEPNTPTYPSIPDNALPSAYIQLSGDQTAILESDIVDARILFGSPAQDLTDIEADIVDLYNQVAYTNRAIAILQAEMDMEISRHIVEG